jgi:NDP-sugar pyrophosphorylase family protein
MQCVVLAGGRGTRMRPHTDTMPKALLPVLGEPFVSWQLRWLAGHGVDRVTLSIGYLGALIRDFVGDGSAWGLPVDYVDEGDHLRGTGGALRLALEQGALDEAFLVQYGDSYLPIDLDALATAWARSRPPAQMTVVRNDNRWDASNVIFRDGRVVVYDKSRPAEHVAEMHWVDYGVSVLTRDLVAEWVPAEGLVDLAETLRDCSLRGELMGYEVSQRFYEVGSEQGLSDLEAYLSRLPSRRP